MAVIQLDADASAATILLGENLVLPPSEHWRRVKICLQFQKSTEYF